MTSNDYIFLYSKLSIDKIPLHIKEKIDSGDEFTEVEKQEILKIIWKENNKVVLSGKRRDKRTMKNDNKVIIGIIILIIGVIGNKLILCLPITSEYGDVVVSLPNWMMRFCLVIFTVIGIFGVVYGLLNYLDLKI